MTHRASILFSSALLVSLACGREAKAPPAPSASGSAPAPVAPISPPAPGLKGASQGPPSHDHAPSAHDHADLGPAHPGTGDHAGHDHAGHDLAAHDPALAPIDCPLRKAHGQQPGVQHKPFQDVAEYIRFLEREDRAAWQKPDEVVAALKLAGDEIVVDFGAGSGYFTFRLAKALPRGRVVALDVEADMVTHLQKRAAAEKVGNVTAQRVAPDADPAFPTGTGLVFVADVLHHVPRRDAWLKKVASSLGQGARLALIEFRMGELPAGPPDAMKISRAELMRLATDAGLVLAEDHAKLLPYQEFLVFRKP